MHRSAEDVTFEICGGRGSVYQIETSNDLINWAPFARSLSLWLGTPAPLSGALCSPAGAAIGLELGISEDAARKRVDRALARMSKVLRPNRAGGYGALRHDGSCGAEPIYLESKLVVLEVGSC